MYEANNSQNKQCKCFLIDYKWLAAILIQNYSFLKPKVKQLNKVVWIFDEKSIKNI